MEDSSLGAAHKFVWPFEARQECGTTAALAYKIEIAPQKRPINSPRITAP